MWRTYGSQLQPLVPPTRIGWIQAGVCLACACNECMPVVHVLAQVCVQLLRFRTFCACYRCTSTHRLRGSSARAAALILCNSSICHCCGQPRRSLLRHRCSWSCACSGCTLDQSALCSTYRYSSVLPVCILCFHHGAGADGAACAAAAWHQRRGALRRSHRHGGAGGQPGGRSRHLHLHGRWARWRARWYT